MKKFVTDAFDHERAPADQLARLIRMRRTHDHEVSEREPHFASEPKAVAVFDKRGDSAQAAVAYQAALHVSAERERRLSTQNSQLIQEIQAVAIDLDRERDRTRELETKLSQYRGETTLRERALISQVQDKDREFEELRTQMAGLKANISARESEMLHRMNSLRQLMNTEKEKLTLALAKRDFELRGSQAALADAQARANESDGFVKRATVRAEVLERKLLQQANDNKTKSRPEGISPPAKSSEPMSAIERITRELLLLPEGSPEKIPLQELLATMLLMQRNQAGPRIPEPVQADG